MEDGPYIRVKVDRELSPRSEDGGFAEALDFFKNGTRIQEANPGLAFALEEIERSEVKGEEGKKKIISDALYVAGLNWIDIKRIEENEEALKAFGYMLAHWDTPKNGNPKSLEDHKTEAEEFVKILKK